MPKPLTLFSLFARKAQAAARPVRAAGERPVAAITDAAWAQRREPERAQDLGLSGVAQRWLESLPPSVRPAALCAQYPRLANRLALCWNDPLLAERLFDELMISKRARRRGFPAEVGAELLRLRECSARRGQAHDAADPWRAQAIADR